jgi:serine/threonine protein kinase
MFRKQDFKKVDLLGSGKKNTKIYKAEHIPTGKYYALKEVEAKTLEKLNEYKVSIFQSNSLYRKKQFSSSRSKTIQTFFNFTATISTKPCTTPSVFQWFASTWTQGRTSNTSSERESSKGCSGTRRSSRK